MYAYKYDENKYYAGQQECQIDPLETKKQGHPVYLLKYNELKESVKEAKTAEEVNAIQWTD